MNIYIYVFLLLVSCSKKRNTQEIHWNISYEYIESEQEHLLKLDYSSMNDTILNVDFKAFICMCYDEDSLKGNTINKIIANAKFSQVISENRALKFRLLSDYKVLDKTKDRTISSFNCYGNLNKEIELKNNNKHSEIISFDNNQDFMVSKNDKQIRLHYIFKPTLEQKQNGLKEYVLTSNWFNVK